MLASAFVAPLSVAASGIERLCMDGAVHDSLMRDPSVRSSLPTIKLGCFGRAAPA